jgi:predicted O-methyltransferase YrrM
MIEILKTGWWFLQRPSFWPHAFTLVARKVVPRRDAPDKRSEATHWAAERAASVEEALKTIGLAIPASGVPTLPASLREEASRLADTATVRMGGPGDIDLLYAATVLSGAKRIVETGVAYGWSSLALLAALDAANDGCLASVDMPYPKMNNEQWVGVAVPERLRARWVLVRQPDRFGLHKAVAVHGDSIDLCHYDSDKSHGGREYGYGVLWKALRSGGIFISDDIQDNLAFRDFVEATRIPFAVTDYEGKYVGIARKP